MSSLTSTRRTIQVAKRPIFLILGLILVGCALLAPAFWWMQQNPFNQRRFDRNDWLASHGEPDSARGPMALDVIRHHLKTGQSRDGVVQMLGRPDADLSRADAKQGMGLKDGELGPDARHVMHYRLGRWSGDRTTEDGLLILLDASGRVLGGGIQTHGQTDRERGRVGASRSGRPR